MDASTILAIMLSLAPPGNSAYSQVSVAPGSEGSDVRPASESPYSRKETREEGTARYAIIAKAIDNVSDGNDEMARMLVTVAFHESGFRRDVHEGVGEASRGDCEWWNGNKRVAAYSPGAHRLAGSCRSSCLAQINLGNNRLTDSGLRHKDLIGVDVDSTTRCMSEAAKRLNSNLSLCKRTKAPPVAGAISLYIGNASCGADTEAIKKRMSTMARIARWSSIR